MEWTKRERTQNCAELHYTADYVISWRGSSNSPSWVQGEWVYPSNKNAATLSYRPVGEHHHVGQYDTIDEAKNAAEKHQKDLTKQG